MSSVLDSHKLINTIRRRAAISRSDALFSNDDFLEMATEEINLGLMQTLIDARGDYLVYHVDLPLKTDKTNYTIPNRAHGNKLRDASIVDDKGSVVTELTQMTVEEISDSQNNYSFRNRASFYMQNDSLVINKDLVRPNHFIRMHFYMRPNKLVLNERSGTISNIVTSTEVDNIVPKSGNITLIQTGTSTIVIAPSHGLTSGKVIITGSNCTPSIDGTHVFSIIDANSFSVPVATTVGGDSASWAKALDVTILNLTATPKNFNSANKYDVVGAESPNKIKQFNLVPNKLDISLKTLSFATSSTDGLANGDYVTIAEETIVPNIPTELHPIVAQRVAVACLESMGDEQNKQSAERKLAQMERSAMKIIANRVEGAPKKIKNRHGTLNSAKRRW